VVSAACFRGRRETSGDWRLEIGGARAHPIKLGGERERSLPKACSCDSRAFATVTVVDAAAHRCFQRIDCGVEAPDGRIYRAQSRLTPNGSRVKVRKHRASTPGAKL